MTLETLPEWLAALDREDLGFIRKFVLASGSLTWRQLYSTISQLVQAWAMSIVGPSPVFLRLLIC